jgi:hypothetical protein
MTTVVANTSIYPQMFNLRKKARRKAKEKCIIQWNVAYLRL